MSWEGGRGMGIVRKGDELVNFGMIGLVYEYADVCTV